MAEEGLLEDLDEPMGVEPLELVVITGLSGAGRSEAIHTFEDLGFFCIDNLPPQFIGQLVELTALPGSRIRRVAVVCDVRAMSFFELLHEELNRLTQRDVPFRLLFLEADDGELVKRFKETRRRHPLADMGSIVAGIRAERTALAPIRARADMVVDTSRLSARELRTTIRETFLAERLQETLSLTITSFGFKYGLPIDADIVMDVRFLPNPYYNPRLRPHSGLEPVIRKYVLDRPETAQFLVRWEDLLRLLTPNYLAEGKTHLAIAMGCTGGMHRSVVLAEKTGEFLRGLGYHVSVSHRDIGRDLEHK